MAPKSKQVKKIKRVLKRPAASKKPRETSSSAKPVSMEPFSLKNFIVQLLNFLKLTIATPPPTLRVATTHSGQLDVHQVLLFSSWFNVCAVLFGTCALISGQECQLSCFEQFWAPGLQICVKVSLSVKCDLKDAYSQVSLRPLCTSSRQTWIRQRHMRWCAMTMICSIFLETVSVNLSSQAPGSSATSMGRSAICQKQKP